MHNQPEIHRYIGQQHSLFVVVNQLDVVHMEDELIEYLKAIAVS